MVLPAKPRTVLTKGASLNAQWHVREGVLARHYHPPVAKLETAVTIMNLFVLHMRPAAMFVRRASRFYSNVWFAKDGVEVDGKSLMSLIALSAGRGAELRVRVEGRDAAEATYEIEQLIRSGFEE